MGDPHDKAPPKVFISYSHDSREHEDRVLTLANRLREEGLEANLDQYEQFPSQGWLNWMQDEVEAADFVLMIFSKPYHNRFRGRVRGGGKGATWEGAIISQELYDACRENTKFIPCIFSQEDGQHIPTTVRAYQHFLIDPGHLDT
ncbi:MAG: TIR domain-containing protein, partial [Candidatus Hydrogenedentes bacterium]|nr:TIR domain-containing protein [Candidatus Hydrogenedentota bacterium]